MIGQMVPRTKPRIDKEAEFLTVFFTSKNPIAAGLTFTRSVACLFLSSRRHMAFCLRLGTTSTVSAEAGLLFVTYRRASRGRLDR